MLLTTTTSNATLYVPLTHSVDGIRNLQRGQKRPVSKLVFLCPSEIINKGLLPVKSFMVGCIEQPLIGLAVPFCGIANLIQSTAQDFAIKVGGLFLKKGHKPMLNHATNPLTISVSTTKQNSLHKQVEIIGYSLDSFCLDSNTNTRATLKADALELVRMLNELDTARHDVEPTHLKTQERKTSLFNVLAKGTKRVIAYKIPFERAIQCHKQNQTVIKFAGMAGGVA